MKRRNEIADLVVLDVRNPRELEDGAIPGALNVPLASLVQRIDELDPARPTRRLLRQRVPVDDRGEQAVRGRFRRCLRPSRRIRRLGRRVGRRNYAGCGTIRR